MQLLDNIINMGTANDPAPLTAVLRQCIVLANNQKAPLLRTWAEQELKGYSNPKDVPEYRIMQVGALGHFEGVGVRYQARPNPSSLLRKEHRWAATVHRLTEPVSSYESLGDTKGALIYEWPSDMIGLYQSSLLAGCVLITAWQQVPKTAIAGVLDTIRTRVLTMAIDIKNESEESGVDLNHVERGSQEAQQIQRSVVTNVYGNLYMIAGDHVVNTQNIAVGNWEDLKKALNEVGIGDGDVAELSQAIEKDGKTMGTGVKGWIGRNADKVLDNGLKLGTSVGATLLTEYVKRHFGLP
jgi:AbiTii-like protein